MIDEPAEQARQAPYVELLDALIAAWDALTVFPPGPEPGDERGRPAAWTRKEPLPQRACLLFNRWAGNPLARQLEDEFPGWARDRFTVPDRYFEDREEHAPVVLELPEEFVLPQPERARRLRPLRRWLVRCLMHADRQRHDRLGVQDFCGVVVSPANAQTLTRHWVGLGEQRPPHGEESVLFRYQDPRVMQRVWTTLSPVQQARWLGPVTQWWALRQPWGPYGAQDEPAQWFQATTPVLPHGTTCGGPASDLFTGEQWFLAGVSPDANAIWSGYARNGIAPQAQPDPSSMVRMLADAARMELQAVNLEDYVWATWRHNPTQGAPHRVDWALPHLAPTLNAIAARLRIEPDTRFATLFAQAIRSKD